MNDARASDVDVAEASHRVADGAVLLDVREPSEWRAGHAPDAVHLPLGRLHPARLPAGAPVVVICRSGHRSGLAADFLVAAGFDAVNVAGGMLAWQAAGFPTVRDDGSPGTVA